jgi:Fic family protein
VNEIKITIPQPQWDSSLTSLIIDLEKLKTKRLESNLPFYIFLQIKDIFKKLETLGSARIEGNNTTLSEYIEKIIDNRLEDEREKEIINLEKAINFIEGNIDEHPINRAFISELHKIVTDGLTPPPIGEGSKNPGMLRTFNVKIHKSKHIPCDVSVLNDYFEEFIKFINEKRKEQYELLSVAIAHHRFSYIHPFDNGNGRVGRLLNYALLIKLGFRVKNGRILNPSSVFYADRNKYYKMLHKSLRSILAQKSHDQTSHN